MIRLLQAFWLNDSGATAIEYGLILTFIALVAMVGFPAVGSRVSHSFNDVANNLLS